MKYRSEIDGLRAISVLSVMLYHAGCSYLPGGFIGVDIFFVISGFLITTTILSELKSKSFSLIGYYDRRLRRIIPNLLVILFFCVPLIWIFLPPGGNTIDFAKNLVATLTFTSNIFLQRTQDYFDSSIELKPLAHTWTLSLEEQYYLLFPLLLLSVMRFGREVSIIAIIIGFIASLGISDYISAYNQPEAFYLLHTRSWEILAGVLTAYLLFYLKFSIRPIIAQILPLIGLILIFGSFIYFNKRVQHPGVVTIIPVLGTILVIISSDFNTVISKFLKNQILVWIGLLSYSIYLWHQPIFVFTRFAQLGEPSVLSYVFLFILTIFLSYLTWRFVEKPFRNQTVLTSKTVYIFCLLGTVMLITLGLYVEDKNGFSSTRWTTHQRELLKSAVRHPRREECHSSEKHRVSVKDACEFNHGSDIWAVFGDSHAVELAYALGKELGDDGPRLRQYTRSACPPTLTDTPTTKDRECFKWTQEAATVITQNKKISHVVLSYRIHNHLFGSHEGVYPDVPKLFTKSLREKTWQEYLNLLQYFLQNGKKVALVLQAPELPAPVNLLVFRSDLLTMNVKGVSVDWWSKREKFVRTKMKDIPKDVVVIDPKKIFCDQSDCYAARNGISLYYDDDHMSVPGGQIIAKEIIAGFKENHHQDGLNY